MPPKPTIKSAKKRAWESFSRYVRLRDCLATTGWPDTGRCVTCGLEKPFEELQAGHFVDGRSRHVLFDERATHAQCYACNVPRKGNKDAYWPFMLDKYGRGVTDELVSAKRKAGTWTIPELTEIERRYKEKEAELAANQP